MGCLLVTPTTPSQTTAAPSTMPSARAKPSARANTIDWKVIREELCSSLPLREGPPVDIYGVLWNRGPDRFTSINDLARNICNGLYCPQTLTTLTQASQTELERHQTLAIIGEVLEELYMPHLEEAWIPALFISESRAANFISIIVANKAT